MCLLNYDEVLVEEVGNRSVLYNSFRKKHKDVFRRHVIWNNLSSLINDTIKQGLEPIGFFGFGFGFGCSINFLRVRVLVSVF
jgi:hypothetical protein